MHFQKLRLLTKNFKEQKDFYSKTLGLCVGNSSESFIVELQHGQLEFVKSDNFKSYHFAFTIPGNKVSEALHWLKERVTIVKDKSNEVVDFPAWNAESIYFYDADHNILEFIARKNLSYDKTTPFNASQLIEISEIGVATAHFTEKFKQLTSIPGVEKFSGGDEVFCAIGEEAGLFILIDKNRKDWFPNNDKAFSANFVAEIKNKKGLFRVNYSNDSLIFNKIQ